ncbi:MAG: DUF2807 domain-containing protein [Chitinophagaceae bacterium]|jgi:hypothetical protein|nr:DUF2807 domain-containing protein [Chitinophagaceae bacterium]
MRKISWLLAAALLLAQAVPAQWRTVKGNGQTKTEQRSVASFNKVGVAGGINVLVTQGAAGLKVEADENLLEYIVTEVSGDKLTVRYKNNVSIRGHALVYVSMPVLNGASIAGSGNIKSDGTITAGDNFTASIAGSGNIDLTTSGAEQVKANIAGSGNIELAGSARGVDVRISGSGSFKGYQLKTTDAEVHISGSGNVETNVNGKLDAVISGSGSVLYKGRAQVSLRSAGSGKVKMVE